MKTWTFNISRLIVGLIALICVQATVFGQESTRVGRELDLLNNEEIVQQLGLSGTQLESVTEAMKGGKPGTEVFKPFMDKMRELKTEEERAPVREEMQKAISNAKEQSREKALTILDNRQINLLRSLFIQRAGIRVLADPRVAKEMGLTEEQTLKLNALADERGKAATSLDFNASADQIAEFAKVWDAKYLALLTDDQKKMWSEQLTTAAALPGGLMFGGQTQGSDATASVGSSSAAGNTPPPGAEVVSSFGSASDSAEGAALVEKFSFNFRYAPWDQVLQDFAAGAGFTLDLNDVPPGTFSHLDGKEYTARQAMDILNGYLQRRGFTLVLKDGFLVCVNVSKTIPPNLIPDVPTDDLLKVEQGIHKIGQNEIVRIEIPLEKLDVGVMAQEVEQLLGPLGTMTAFTQTGSLIIADTGSNLRRIKSYVDLSMSRRIGELVFRTYPLKNIDAGEAEFMLLSQFGMRQGVTNVSAGGGGGDRRGQPPAPVPPAPQSTLKVMSDARTNSLLVTASPDQQTLVEEIVKAIDIPEGEAVARGRTGPYLKVYKVTGRADQVAQSITAMMPGVVVNEDGAAGTVHIFGTSKQHEQVEEWVRAFSSGAGTSGSVAVIPLAKMDPLTAAATLRNLFLSEGNAAPTVETDLYGNRIIVKGSAAQVEQIKQVLLDLGEDGKGIRPKGEGGIRRYSLRGRDPGEFFQYLEQEWRAAEKTSIRVVVPKKSGPIKGLKTPSDEEESAGKSPEDSTTRVSPSRSGLRKQSGYLPVTRPTDEQISAIRDDQKPAAQDAGDGIQIVVDGDELLLLSRDEEALDRLEEMMDFLQQSIPFRTKWTVFYLQAADATEAAALLEQFIPSSSVSSTSSTSSFGLSSMFSPITQSVSSMTGLNGIGPNPQTLRIIPDPRSNSLFVTGPQSLVEEAEGFLEVLDSTNIPESLRDLQPRRIEVQYAEIDAIATMVNDTFKPYLEPPGGRQQQQNPLAQMFGGGGGAKGNEPQGIQMTVSVDRQTSSLIISSSESLFNKVQAMVKESDEAARKANATVRVVQLRNSDATMMQQSLTSLFPRVTSSATRTSSSSTNNGGQGGQQQTPTDPFQQMMQDRMRQQGQNQGNRGGATPFGGGAMQGRGGNFGGGNFGGGNFGGGNFGGGNFGGGNFGGGARPGRGGR